LSENDDRVEKVKEKIVNLKRVRKKVYEFGKYNKNIVIKLNK